jgi:hypothetical protein
MVHFAASITKIFVPQSKQAIAKLVKKITRLQVPLLNQNVTEY